jgi:hypothetical protein
MTLKHTKIARLFLSLSLLLCALAFSLADNFSAHALHGSSTLPSFREFSKSVQNGQTNDLRGVYVDKVLALTVVQQPADNNGYVSLNTNETTQFHMAAQLGNVGLLAHNYLAGKLFSQLVTGQEVRLIYGDGHVVSYVVKEILSYQALQPNSQYSSFKNPGASETLTTEQLFNKTYGGEHHLTFQTCIEAQGNPSWGRLFIIAIPKK